MIILCKALIAMGRSRLQISVNLVDKYSFTRCIAGSSCQRDGTLKLDWATGGGINITTLIFLN